MNVPADVLVAFNLQVQAAKGRSCEKIGQVVYLLMNVPLGRNRGVECADGQIHGVFRGPGGAGSLYFAK